MAEIVPAINVSDFAAVKRLIEISARSAKLVHIDVADGSFTSTVTWHNAEDMRGYASPMPIEIHFMVQDPDKKISSWFMPQVKRIIFHVEATADPNGIIAKCHQSNCEAGVAIRPDTSYEKLIPFKDTADLLQVLAVTPGPSGQEFDQNSLKKIAALRALAPGKIIEVDGGIKPGIARSCAFAGADLIVAGSALFGNGIDFNKAFLELSDDIKHKDS